MSLQPLNNYVVQLEALVAEHGDILAALQKSGKAYYGFKNTIGNPVLKELQYVATYDHPDGTVYVFVGKKDGLFHITASPKDKKSD